MYSNYYVGVNLSIVYSLRQNCHKFRYYLLNKLGFDKLFAVTFTATMYKYREQSKILQKKKNLLMTAESDFKYYSLTFTGCNKKRIIITITAILK